MSESIFERFFMIDWLNELNPQFNPKDKTNDQLEKEIKEIISVSGILGLKFLTKLHIDSMLLKHR